MLFVQMENVFARLSLNLSNPNVFQLMGVCTMVIVFLKIPFAKNKNVNVEKDMSETQQ